MEAMIPVTSLPHSKRAASTKDAGSTKEPGSNRRRHFRYGFKTELRYKVTRNGAVLLAGRGSTVDMGAGGLLVSVDRSLPMGARIEVTLDWPGLCLGRTSARLVVFGQIVRAGEATAAVRILHHEFHAFGEAARPGTARGNTRGQLAVA